MLEELFAEQLSAARILVLPVHGHRHHAGLLDMSVFLLGTATPVAALFDGVGDAAIKTTRADAEYRRQHLDHPGALGTIAKIVAAEHEHAAISNSSPSGSTTSSIYSMRT